MALGDKYANQIVIRARDNSWGNGGRADKVGKQRFLASAAEELQRLHAVTITDSTTLLIDDDSNNTDIARECGVRVILFNPEEPRK